MSILNGKNVLITGGTGSFGKCFVKTVLEKHSPRRLVVFSRDELKQFEMQEWAKAPYLEYIIGDVRDKDRLRWAFNDIDLIIHAAAMKQVPASEQNPLEAIRTNVNGAENVINMAIECGVSKVIALSTDKACNPANLYGATKLCSDKLFIAANGLHQRRKCRFSVVRYGNVVGSRGSVIPFFMKKRETGKVPITDVRMTRFMITLEQGVEFVLRCLERMEGGELFVPKIPTMTLLELKEAVAPDCEIELIGIRPGEKIHEMMISAADSKRTLEFDDHYVIQPQTEWWDSEKYLKEHKAKQVADGFEYDSSTNTVMMTKEDLRKILLSSPIEAP